MIAQIIKKRKEDPQVAMRYLLRYKLWHALKGDIGSAEKAWMVEHLGCSLKQFRAYIEDQFQPGMSWNNWSKDGWHMDHIKPLSMFDLTDERQLKQASHHTNIQPLWREENCSKQDRWIS